MSKFMETASAAVTAASLVALVLASALFTRTSWADEPLSANGCQGCLTNATGACTPCSGDCENSGDGDQCDSRCKCISDPNNDDVLCQPPFAPFPIEVPMFECEIP